MSNEQYLGDGVYVKFDGYRFMLMANIHGTPTDIIYLEPSVVKSLFEFIEKQRENKENPEK